MKCPYCSETVKDQAKVCRHCNRDFILLDPYQQMITSLEKQVSTLKEERAALERQLSEDPPLHLQQLASLEKQVSTLKEERAALERQLSEERSSRRVTWLLWAYWKRIFLAMLLSILVFVGSNAIWSTIDYLELDQAITEASSSSDEESDEEPAPTTLSRLALSYVISILGSSALFGPLLLGYWASRRWAGRHLGSYLLFGSIVGLIGLPLQLTIDWLLLIVLDVGADPDFPDVPVGVGNIEVFLTEYVNWLHSITAFFITPVLMFISGALFADNRKVREYSPEARRTGLAAKLAEYLAKSIPRVVVSERLIESIRLSGPIIAAIIGLISALIGLGAAIGKGGG